MLRSLNMKAVRVHVENGEISGRAPAGFPEGDVEVCLAEPEESMTADEEARLNAALEAGWHCIEQGRVRPASDVIEALRRR
jgi:hypothetical protein